MTDEEMSELWWLVHDRTPDDGDMGQVTAARRALVSAGAIEALEWASRFPLRCIHGEIELRIAELKKEAANG